jgi:hypothetical protein
MVMNMRLIVLISLINVTFGICAEIDPEWASQVRDQLTDQVAQAKEDYLQTLSTTPETWKDQAELPLVDEYKHSIILYNQKLLASNSVEISAALKETVDLFAQEEGVSIDILPQADDVLTLQQPLVYINPSHPKFPKNPAHLEWFILRMIELAKLGYSFERWVVEIMEFNNAEIVALTEEVSVQSLVDAYMEKYNLSACFVDQAQTEDGDPALLLKPGAPKLLEDWSKVCQKAVDIRASLHGLKYAQSAIEYYQEQCDVTSNELASSHGYSDAERLEYLKTIHDDMLEHQVF